MDTLTYTVHVPVEDQSFFESLAPKMGWIVKRQEEKTSCNLDEALKTAE